jgi:hypothetical protein
MLSLRLLRLVLCTSFLIGAFPACSIVEPGAPSAAITVRGRSRFEVQDVVERVFTARGYIVSGRSMDSLTLQREAGKTDRLMYGNWISGEVSQQVKVTIASRGEGKYRVRCLPSVVRNPDDVSFHDDNRRWQLFSFHYSSILREVREELR